MIVLNENDILLFQGDSITHGGRVESDWDMNHIMGHGYQSILASRIGYENLGTHPVILNRGVSGDSTEKLCERWQRDALDLHPTILSILIGINDSHIFNGTSPSVSPEMSESNLRTVLDKTVAENPKIKLILCEPFSFLSPTSLNDDKEKKEQLKRIETVYDIASRIKNIADDYGAVYVPFWNELKKYVETSPTGHIIWDGVHPTYIGHEIMARYWYKTVDESNILK